MSFTDDRAQKNLHDGLYGLTNSLPKLRAALLDIKKKHVHLIKNDIDNIMFSLPLCENKEISDLFEDYFDCNIINFLANVDDLLHEIESAIKGTDAYHVALDKIMYPDR
ncbi:hypothetical protein [Leuconostoc pseudomesenteroides]|uniref:hypothetical protein n=1 Tax=Leuconostoc pseudomesenteroides TaxID=33968 RepID=UPI0032DF0B30